MTLTGVKPEDGGLDPVAAAGKDKEPKTRGWRKQETITLHDSDEEAEAALLLALCSGVF